MLYYLTYQTINGKKYPISIEITKENATALKSANPDNIDWVHWDTDESGMPPEIYNPTKETPTEFIDNRTYAQKRRAGYRAECDYMYPQVAGDIEDGENEEDAKAAWLAAREAIATKYPNQ